MTLAEKIIETLRGQPMTVHQLTKHLDYAPLIYTTVLSLYDSGELFRSGVPDAYVYSVPPRKRLVLTIELDHDEMVEEGFRFDRDMVAIAVRRGIGRALDSDDTKGAILGQNGTSGRHLGDHRVTIQEAFNTTALGGTIRPGANVIRA